MLEEVFRIIGALGFTAVFLAGVAVAMGVLGCVWQCSISSIREILEAEWSRYAVLALTAGGLAFWLLPLAPYQSDVIPAFGFTHTLVSGLMAGILAAVVTLVERSKSF
jgi:peptidoglycan/LPS O-acetylase OafA/YrhL